MKKEQHSQQSIDNERIVPTGCAMPNPVGRVFTAALAVLAFIVAGVASTSAQQLEAQPTRFTVQSGVSGQVTNTISFTVDTNETVNLSVDTSGATGVTSAVLDTTTFTAPANDVLDATVGLTVNHDGTVPQTGINEVAVIAVNAFNDRLPVPINAAVIWAGDTNNTAYETAGNWEGSAVPTSSDVVVFPSAGATTIAAATNNVIISGSTALNGLRFSHGDEADDEFYRVEIKPGVTVAVIGTEGFTMLRDTVNVFDEMWAELLGGGSLVVSNSAANWTMLGESGSANDLVLNMEGLKSFTADVDRVGLGSYEFYPNYETNGYGTEPDQWIPNVTLAETNFIRTAWIGGEDVITNKEARPYAFTLAKMPTGGTSSGQQYSLIFGRTNVFFVDTILIGGSGAKGAGDNQVRFNTDTNVIPAEVVPTAYFRGTNDSSRISVFAIADASGPGESGSSAKGHVNLTDGKVDALVDLLYVGRDRWKSSDNAVGQGELSIGGDNAAGTIFDVNTAYISMQDTGNNASDPEDDDDPSGEVYGELNVGANAVFKVNDTLHLGYTTADANDKRDAEAGDGSLNIRNGGTLMANQILVGGVTQVSVDNRISITGGGELIVTNEIGQTDKSLASLSMNDSTLTLHLDGSKTTSYVYADEVVTGGSGNTIKLAAVVNVVSFPTQLPLIAYTSASPNFGVEMPAGFYGYIVNNTVDSTIDVVILNTAPAALVWDSGTWDTVSASWQGGLVFANGDTARFDDTAISPSVNVPGQVFIGGSGVLVTNSSVAFSISGAGVIGGTSPMNKWGSGSLAVNVTSQLPLTVHEGLVTGSGAVGSTSVGSNGTLSFSGAVTRLVSSGSSTLLAGSSVANGVDVNGGTLSNAGAISGVMELAGSNTLAEVTPSGTVTMSVPSTAEIGEDTILDLDGVWNNGILNGPAGTYRIDVLGTMTGIGNIQTGSPNISHGSGEAPGYWSRLVIGSGGVLSPGAAPGDLTVFETESQVDFQPGATIILDVDMDSADGSNPKANGPTGSTAAKNSDVIFTSRWSTRTGTLQMNNVGTADWAVGTVLKVFSKPFEEFGGGFRNRVFDGTTNQLPVMDPSSPGLGMLWNLQEFSTNGVITIDGTASTPPVLLVTPSQGTNITFAWPSGHIGWELQRQTNPLDIGLSTNWGVVPGSTTTNLITITNWISDDLIFEVYRLAHPEFD